MIYDRIKFLREQAQLTQSDLAKALGVTRSSVNAWELGISKPSTHYVVELAERFKVSTDYILGVENTSSVNIAGLSAEDARIVIELIAHLRKKNTTREHYI